MDRFCLTKHFFKINLCKNSQKGGSLFFFEFSGESLRQKRVEGGGKGSKKKGIKVLISNP